MRFAMADAGDALDDANFEHTTANGAILRLTKVLFWLTVVSQAASKRAALAIPGGKVTTYAYQNALRTTA